MTNRWTVVSKREFSSERIRNEDVSRRSGKLRYWLLLPAAGVLMYAGIAWLLMLILSPLTRLRGVFGKRPA